MTLEELKQQAIKEIEIALLKLGDSGSSDIFPDFNMDWCDLEYGIQNDNDNLLIETKCRNGETKNRILIRVKIEVENADRDLQTSKNL